MAFFFDGAEDFVVKRMPSFQFIKPAANSYEILDAPWSNPTGNGEMC